MRKLVITVLVLAGLLLAVDRVAAYAAGTVVAGKLRTSAELDTDPKVTVKGFPFLTQALRGRYDRIDVEAVDVSRGGVRLSELDTTLTGARIPLGGAVAGEVTAVPVEGLTARVVATYTDISAKSGIVGLRIVPAGKGLRLTGRLTALGQTVSGTATSSVALDGDDLVVTAQSVSVAGRSSAVLDQAIAGRFDFRVKVGTLPYGLELKTVAVDAGGLVLRASTGATVLTAP